MGAYRAVKIVSRRSFDHARPFERELGGIEKFEPISRSHKSFVDILHVGRHAAEDCFYYVMELGDDQVTGQRIDPEKYRPKTLATMLAEHGRLPVAECLQIGINLADGLEHLHGHGLSHRDIKPANIIFVNDAPKLADIGLVTGIGEGRSYVGTEGFIPPEGPGTPQADIYSLGMVLYELSTGKDRRDSPALPEDFATYPDASQFSELNEVILRACQGDVQRRYASAAAMLSDLMVLRNGQSVQRLHALERRLRNAKKAVLVGGIILALLALFLYPAALRNKFAREQRERQIGSTVSAGQGALEQGHMTMALASFTEALHLTEGMADREQNHRLRCSTVLAFCPKLTHVSFLGTKVTRVEFSPDGRCLLPSIWERKTQLLDLERGAFIGPEFHMDTGVDMASSSPDGRLIITTGVQKDATIWESGTGNEIHRLPHPSKVFIGRFNQEGTRVVTACFDYKARIWDCATGLLRAELSQHKDAVLYAEFSRDGRWVVTASRDGTARLWDAETGQPTGIVLVHPSWVYTAAFSPDGRHIVTAGFDRKARIWETTTGRFLPPTLNHGDAVTSAEYSPDGRLLVTACMDRTVRIWESATQLPCARNSVLRHSSRVLHAGFDPAGHRIASTCNDGTLRIWDLAGNLLIPENIRDDFSLDGSHFLTTSNQWVNLSATADQPASVRIPAGEGLRSVAFNPEGKWLITVATGQMSRLELRLWNTAMGNPVAAAIPLPWVPSNMVVDPGGRMIAACAGTNVLVWALSSGGWDHRPKPTPGKVVNGLQFNLGGRQLLLQSEFDIWLYDPVTGRALIGPLKHSAPISHVEFNLAGDRFVTSCADQQLNETAAQVWSTRTGQRIGQPLPHADGVLWAAFSPDGGRVVTASEDFTARVWDAATGRPLTPPMRHEDQVHCARFSPDGRWIITAATDKMARIWDANTGEPLTPPLPHSKPLWHARLFSDGQRLVTGINQERAWLWRLPVDPRPAADLSALASLLTGQLPEHGEEARGSQLSTGRKVSAHWRELKGRYPATFAITPAELIYWHVTQSERAESDQQWSAVVFHLQRLLVLSPTNQVFAERLAQAQSKLAAENNRNGSQ
jgi:WD40 repeat protein